MQNTLSGATMTMMMGMCMDMAMCTFLVRCFETYDTLQEIVLKYQR